MNPISVNSYNSYNNPYYSGGMNYYPQNTYPTYYEQTSQDSDSDSGAKTLGLAALLQGLALGIQKGAEFFSKKLSMGKEFTSFENVQKVTDYMSKKNNLSTKIHYIDQLNQHKFAHLGPNIVNEVASGRNAFFHPLENIAVAPKCKPSLMPHEVGHAINFTKPFTRALQKFGRYAMAAPTALLLANRMLPKSQDGKQTFIERNAGILGFSAFIPTLIEEGVASMRGINAAKKVLGNPQNLKLLKKNYAMAWMTYLLGGVALGIASKQAIIQDKQM